MAPKVTLYTTTTCQPCRLVAKKLDAEGVAFEKVVLDLPENAETLAALKARLGREMLQTPILEVDGAAVMEGMNPAALSGVITRAKEAA